MDVLMESMHVDPRTLADDLLAIVAAENHTAETSAATYATHTYLTFMGAAVATRKSILFSDTNEGKEIE